MSTLGALWLAASSCSVLYDFNTKQCSTTDDCIHKGSAFANSVCQNNVCVAVAATGGAPSTGGQSSTDTSTGGDTSAGGATSTVGGSDAIGGDSATGGTSAATTTAPACVNKTCMEQNAASGLYTCISDKCVPLTTAKCDVVIPQAATDPAYNYQKLLEAPNPIIIGGFASMGNTGNHHDTVAIVNWDMALAEFNQTTQGGLPSADGSANRRPIVGLICDGNTTAAADINSAMAHLAGDLHVPGILSVLSSDNLVTAFNYTIGQDYINANGTPVFFMSSSSASMALTTLNDNGLVWHVLGNPRLLAGTMVSLIKRIEPVVNKARQDYATANPTGPDSPSTPNSLNVTIVYTNNSTTLVDLENLLTGGEIAHPETALAFDNSTVATLLANGNLRAVGIAANATDPTPVINELKAHPPHIILALSSAEFPKTVLPYIESNTWASSFPTRMRPYYVLAQSLYNSKELQATLALSSMSSYQVDKRIIGVNYAQIQDDTSKQLYQSYLQRLTISYQSYAGASGPLLANLPGTENMYDAAYYMLYSTSAAAVKRTSFSGSSILSGFVDKVISTGATTVGVGPSSITTTISSMYTASFPPFAMSLWGCDGPPNFDQGTGTRLSPTSAWCIQYDSTQSAWAYQADGLLYDATNKVFTVPTTGAPACLQNY